MLLGVPAITWAAEPSVVGSITLDGVVYTLYDNSSATVTGYTEDLPEHVLIPASVTVGGGVHRVTSIGANAFRNCASLLSVVSLSDSAFAWYGSFAGCSSLRSVFLAPAHAADGAFDGCTSLRFAFRGSHGPWNSLPSGATLVNAGVSGVDSYGRVVLVPKPDDFYDTPVTLCAHSAGPLCVLSDEFASVPVVTFVSDDDLLSDPGSLDALGGMYYVCSLDESASRTYVSYALAEGSSPYLYPDGTRISDSPATRSAATSFDVNGEVLDIILQDPLGVLSSPGDQLGVQVSPISLPDDFDEDVDVEHAHSYQIVPTVNGQPVSGQLAGKVRLLYKIPEGWDRSDLEAYLARAGEDVEFDERIETINGAEYLAFWTDHFSPYIFVDLLSETEKAALGAQTGDLATQLSITGFCIVLVLALGIMLRLITNKKKFEE